MRRVGTVVLAAGKGTRMRSRFPKVTHQVGGRPMLEHVLRAVSEAASLEDASALDTLGDDAEDHSPHIIVVVGHEREYVRSSLHWTPPNDAAADSADTDIAYIVQEPQLGTGDAVRCARAVWNGQSSAPSTILVLYGDTPLVRATTLAALLDEHQRTGATLTFLTGQAEDPTGYGRVLRNGAGRVRDIVEQKHATADELGIREVNSGIYCIEADWLWPHLEALETHPNGEYYLTDLVASAVRDGRTVSTVSATLDETMGVNDRIQLAEAERIMRQRVLHDLMLSGVTIEDPATTYVDASVRVGQDTVLRPGTALRGSTVIGERCDIGPNSMIRDSTIGDSCMVLASWLEAAIMESGSRIGPMSRLRAGAHLMPGANVGNFGEVKNATIGEQVQMHHFSYIGDATVGAHTNIGAGAITMNYDGTLKHHTNIGEHVFIGCDTLLRAPVTVGDGASTGGGAVVTRDVPAGKLAVGMPARVARRVRSAPSEQTEEQVAGEPPAHPPDTNAYVGGDASSQPASDAGSQENTDTTGNTGIYGRGEREY